VNALFERYDGNPILSAREWGPAAGAAFNPAAAEYGGETLLLVRVEARTGLSYLGLARSADGVSGWQVEPQRSLVPELESEEERFGIEDPRITQIG
jgi:beta-1,4-mannooligosaccharide/beta-1,4-mannosyl-N-acetylglucosamine phosphorylase